MTKTKVREKYTVVDVIIAIVLIIIFTAFVGLLGFGYAHMLESFRLMMIGG